MLLVSGSTRERRKVPDQTVIAFLCPNCGAEVDVLEGYTNIRCEFCSSRLLITQRIGIPRVFARPKLKSPKKFLKNRIGKDTKIVDLDLLFIPLIKVNAEIIGWIKGHKKGKLKRDHTQEVYSRTQPVESIPRIEGEKLVKKRIRRIQELKIDPSEFYRFGIERVKIKGKKFEAYNDNLLHQFGNVFDLSLSIDEYIKKTSEILINNITREYKKWDEFKHYLRVIKKSAIIYYNPIYFARVQIEGTPYTYSFDAVNGNILLREEVIRKEGKKTIELNLLYSLIGCSGILISLVSSFIGKMPAFLTSLFILFFLWWSQYGSK